MVITVREREQEVVEATVEPTPDRPARLQAGFRWGLGDSLLLCLWLAITLAVGAYGIIIAAA